MKVLKGATLIDGTGGTPIPNATVVVDGERIVDVGPADAVTSPPGASVVDLSGMTLLPGLIDCHDHLGHTGYGLMDRWELDAPASLRHLRTAQVLQTRWRWATPPSATPAASTTAFNWRWRRA